jgi:hypothetical protein
VLARGHRRLATGRHAVSGRGWVRLKGRRKPLREAVGRKLTLTFTGTAPGRPTVTRRLTVRVRA